MNVRELKRHAKRIEYMRKELADLQDQITTDVKYIQSVCHHPDTYIKTNKVYVSGSYYDTNHTKYTPQCTLCGVMGKTEIIDHGSYG